MIMIYGLAFISFRKLLLFVLKMGKMFFSNRWVCVCMVVTVDVCKLIRQYERDGCVIEMSDGYPWNGWICCNGACNFVTGVFWDYVYCKCREGSKWACKVLALIEEEWKRVTGH